MAFEIIPGGSGTFRWQIDFGWQLNGRSAPAADNLGSTVAGFGRIPYLPKTDAEGETCGTV